MYDDGRAVRAMDQEVGHIKPKQVYMLVYARRGGDAVWQRSSREAGVAGSPSSARRRLGRKTSEAELSRTDGRGDVAGVPGVIGSPGSSRRRRRQKTFDAEWLCNESRGDVAGTPGVAGSPASARRKVARSTPGAELSRTDGPGDVDPRAVGDGACAEWGTPKKRRVTRDVVSEDPIVAAPPIGLATTPEQRANASRMGASLVEG